MQPFWDQATRHEDKFASGIADVSFVSYGKHGWMELKKIDKWPVRASTQVRCRHYTAEQRNFLVNKGGPGGNTWLFVKIERDYLLIHWQQAIKFGELNKEDTMQLAFAHWYNRVDWEELAAILGVGHK
jgi:hypothetical protein